MRYQFGRSRLTSQEMRAVVARALLHVRDYSWLSDSPLVGLAEVQRRAFGSTRIFFEGRALSELISETVLAITDELEEPGKLGIVRDVLLGVCAGKSIAAVAREHGRTREHFSRSYWPFAVQLVADRLRALPASGGVPYTTGKVRKQSA